MPSSQTRTIPLVLHHRALTENESCLCSFLEMGKHTNHMALNETHMSWLADILQNYFPSLPNFSLLLNEHARFQMRRIWMLDPAGTPDTSTFCLEGSVLHGPFINEAEMVRKVIFSTWCSCWGLTPNPSHSGTCHIARSFSCHLLQPLRSHNTANSMGNATKLTPQPDPLSRTAPTSPQKTKEHLHQRQQFPPGHSTPHNLGFKEPLGSNYLHQGDQKKGAVSA